MLVDGSYFIQRARGFIRSHHMWTTLINRTLRPFVAGSGGRSSPLTVLAVLGVCVLIMPWDISDAAEAGRLIEKDGKYVFVESMDPATRLLLERALKQGTITREEFDAV